MDLKSDSYGRKLTSHRIGGRRRERFGGPYPAALECLTDSRTTYVAAAELTLIRSLRCVESLVYASKPRNPGRKTVCTEIPYISLIGAWHTPVNKNGQGNSNNSADYAAQMGFLWFRGESPYPLGFR